MPHRHEFDIARASDFLARPIEKTAILVRIPNDETVVLEAPFGTQVLRGPFYAVAEGAGSYGASKDAFESTHRRVGPARWVRSASVSAYQVDENCTVETFVDDLHESSVEARPGDWIVRQPTGEVMVITPTAFAERYRPADADVGHAAEDRE